MQSAAIRASKVTSLRFPRRYFLAVSETSGIPSPWIRPSSSSSSLQPQHDDSLPSIPIDFSVAARIEGQESQVAIVKLRPGEKLRAESASMLFMTKGVEMSTTMSGVSSAFQRMMTGQNVFLTEFTYNRDEGEGTVGLGADFPAKIVRLSLDDYGGSLVAQRGAYLASNPTVDIQMEFTRTFSAGFFGGQGFILQRLRGDGDVLVKAGGALVEKELQEGEVLRVTSGSIVAFESSVQYDVQMMKGVKNVMFGGEGLFITSLRGPGKVWLQGMPADRMLAEIASRVPAGRGFGPIIPVPVPGGGGTSGGEVTPGTSEGATGVDSVLGDSAAATGVGTGEGVIEATDQAALADRQTTVASSGMGGDDSSSGMAFPSNSTEHDSTWSPVSGNEGLQETTFADDGTTFSNTPDAAFSDDTSFSTTDEGGFGQQQGEFFNDGAEMFGSGGAQDAPEAVAETGSSIFSTLWDFFMGLYGDD